jgi:membrane fusion protein (multidrug efflux system)
VRAEAARLESIRASITVTGTITPAPGADWTITAPETGRVVEMPKAEGDLVKEGDLLARFEVPSLTAELVARQSDVTAATARVQSARSAATRLSGLLARGIASQRDTDDAHRELQDAEASLGQAQSAKAAADAVAARVVIRARFAGVVVRRWHSPGDAVEASASDPVLRVIDPTRLEIVAPVPMAQVATMAPGSPARIFNPADASMLDGSVIAVPTLMNAGAATGDVRVSLPATLSPTVSTAAPVAGATAPVASAANATAPAAGPLPLTVGMAVQLEIMSEERPNAIVIPSSAVLREGMDAYVMVAGADGKAHRQSIMPGLAARERTQVIAGLRPGELVILAGPEPVPDGALITVQK